LAQSIADQTEHKGRLRTHIRARLVLAIASSERQLAVDHVRAALELAQPSGHLRLIVDEGAALAPVLYALADDNALGVYAQRLLALFPETPSAPALAEHPAIIEPLSGRELEVLKLLADGLTNKEIAQRLFVSHHTIKVHARNIYSKLDVHNRTGAVARARAIGLITG